MNNILISLDTSSSSTGWAKFFNGKYIESGQINLKNIKDTNERLKNMVIKLNDLLTRECELNDKITVVIETPVVVRNPQVQRLLTMIFGAVYTICLQNEIEFQQLRPTEWRKLIDSGKKPRKRDELKEWSKQKVKELFKIEDINDDISDAILIGQAYINMCNK